MALFRLLAGALIVGVNRIPDRFLALHGWRTADRILGGVKGVLVLGSLATGLLSWRIVAAVEVSRESMILPRLADGCRAIVLLVPRQTRHDLERFGERTRRKLAEGGQRLGWDFQVGAFPRPAPKSATSVAAVKKLVQSTK